MENFYRKFKPIAQFPLWSIYLRYVYRKTLWDAIAMDTVPIRNRQNPVCLLCGVGSEVTAREYIKSTLKENPTCQFIIIDLGDEQIASVKKLIENEFPKTIINIKQANALNLNFISDRSVDWIDTDGFFSFFDEAQLILLFKEWKRILTQDGYITFRELVSKGFFTKSANRFRRNSTYLYMGTVLHLHTYTEMIKDFQIAGFRFLKKSTPLPFMNRYCLVNI